MEQAEKEYLEEKFNGLENSLKAGKELDASKHKEIQNHLKDIRTQIGSVYSEQKKTNGRVRDLEKSTYAAQMLQKRPVLFLGLLFLVAFLMDVFTDEQVISLLKGFL